MRLSLGQQMQLAQKQVLAPRMIQSMEILQLPLMALQERIEQEMEDNPVLDQVEVDENEPEKPPTVDDEATSSVADTERELVVKDDRNNEDDFERLLNMAENLPDDYEERSRPSLNRIEAGRRSPPRRDGQHAGPARIARRLSAPPAELVRARRAGPPDGRADHLQPRHERLPEDAARRTAAAARRRSSTATCSRIAPSRWRSPKKRCASCSGSIRRASARARSKNA